MRYATRATITGLVLGLTLPTMGVAGRTAAGADTSTTITTAVGQPQRFGLGLGRYDTFRPDPKRTAQVSPTGDPLHYQHKCRQGEAVGAACSWDARHDGNGQGRSFIWTGHRQRFYSHTVMHRVRNSEWHSPKPGQRGWWDTVKGRGRIYIGRDDRVSIGDTSYALQRGRPGPVGTT